MNIKDIIELIEEENKMKKGYGINDIYKVINSSMDYQSKEEKLKEMRDYASLLFREVNIANDNLKYKDYIGRMQTMKLHTRFNLIWQTILSLSLTSLSGYNIYDFANYVIENQNVLELQSQDLLKLLVTILILPILSGVIDVKTIKNYINYAKYDNEIDSYNLRLKDKIHY